jgi:hypothetical protein
MWEGDTPEERSLSAYDTRPAKDRVNRETRQIGRELK